MTDLPAWIQEIRDRVDKATPGPWAAEDANPHKPHKRFAFYIPEIMSAPSMPQYDGLTEEDAAFIAHSRTDVPRLIGLVGEMAKVLEAAREEVRDALLCSNSIECGESPCCTAITPCAGVQIDAVYRKYYGEVSSND